MGESVEKMEISNLPSVRPSEIVELEEENDENILPANIEVFAKKSKKHNNHDSKEKEDPLFLIEGNTKVDKLRKIQAKKAKKDARRREKVAETLSNQMDDAFSALTT